MNTTTDLGTSRAERIAMEVREKGDVVLSNGLFVAAGVAVAASVALRFFAVRQILKFGPPRVMPIANGLSMLAPILLGIGLARKIDRLAESR